MGRDGRASILRPSSSMGAGTPLLGTNGLERVVELVHVSVAVDGGCSRRGGDSCRYRGRSGLRYSRGTRLNLMADWSSSIDNLLLLLELGEWTYSGELRGPRPATLEDR